MIDDRKLGDEWEEWDGDFSDLEMDVETGKRVFLGFAIVTIFIVALGTAFIWYMIKPRMMQISDAFTKIVEAGVILFICVLFIGFSLVVFSIVMNRDFIIRLKGKIFTLTFLTPLILTLGEKCGISYDRMGNSFIKVSNSIIQTKRRNVNSNKILILLPRCLTKSLQKKIKELAIKYECLIYTVPGGSLARKIIARERPGAIIGVACERDLMSGIRDVTKIPVIGITNKRPEGPCKNTIVDFDKIEDAICYFMNMDHTNSTHQLAH